MITIDKETLEMCKDIISDIKEVGVIGILKKVAVTPTTSVTNPINPNMKDLYSEFYNQTKNESPIINTTYDVNALVSYSPIIDELNGAGLNEKCHIMIIVCTYEFIDNKFITTDNDINYLIENLKRNNLINVNGKDYLIKEVGATAIYKGFPLMCNLGCDEYVG